KIIAAFSRGSTSADGGSQSDIRARLSMVFSPTLGFGSIAHIDYTDGIRIQFDNGDVAHVRPSGNADEMRIYAVADSQARADEIAALGIAEPDGILRSLERAVTQGV